MTRTLSVTNIIDPNSPPIAGYGEVYGFRTQAFEVTPNVVDPDGDPYTLHVVEGDANVVNVTNLWFILPQRPGTNRVEFYAVDAYGDRSNTNQFLGIATNRPPVASDASFTNLEDQAISGSLQVSDSDHDVFSISVLVEPEHGVLVVNGTNWTFDPGRDWHGQTSFCFKANDAWDDSSEAVVELNVIAVNDPPTANDDSYTIDEETLLTVTAPGVLGNDTDVESDPLTAVLESGPANGTLSLNGDGGFEYTPNPDFHGEDSFAYRATDTLAGIGLGTVTIVVRKENVPPIISDLLDIQINEDESTGPLSFTVGDVETPAAELVLSAASSNEEILDSAGIVFGGGESNRTITATPLPDKNGTVMITITVSDGRSQTQGQMTVTINPVPDAPQFRGGLLDNSAYIDRIFWVTNEAYDVDDPNEQLVFGFSSGRPCFASINATNGVFRWAPSSADLCNTNEFAVWVTDSSPASLSATQEFAVYVTPYLLPVFGAASQSALNPGETAIVPIMMHSGKPVVDPVFALEFPANSFSQLELTNLAAEFEAFCVQAASATRTLIFLTNRSGTTAPTDQPLGELRLTTNPSLASGFLPIRITDLRARLIGGPACTSLGEARTCLRVVGPQALLGTTRAPDGTALVVLFGQFDTAYQLQSTTNLLDPQGWRAETTLTLTNLQQTIKVIAPDEPMKFYRVLKNQ